jgi:hypothetical protein
VNPGTGINATISGTSTINPTINITNTAPDVIVGLTGGNTIGVSGAYPNFTLRTNVTTTQRLLGRYSAGAGAYEEIQIGTGLNLSAGGVLTGTGTGGTYTVDNGLSPQTTPTANPNNFQLGGALTKDTTINGGTFGIVISSGTTSPKDALNVTNSGSGVAILGQSTGSATGVSGIAASGTGVSGSTTNGYGVVANMSGGTGVPLSSTASNSTTSTILTVINLTRETTGTAGNGIGQQIIFNTETDANVWIANKLISKWSNAVEANRTSEFEITTVNNTIESTALTLKGTGQLQLNKYTAPFSGTAAYALGVDASGNVITTTGGGGGTVTSVAATVPNPTNPAFSVSVPNPTTTPSVDITANGIVSQYIRGDGSLANFPSSTGGGSSVSYYLNGSVPQGTFGGSVYYQMSKTPVLGGGTTFTRPNSLGNGLIAQFITDANDPSLLSIPGGNWNLELFFKASSNGGSPSYYVELYKYDTIGLTFTLIATDALTPEGITNGTVLDAYFTALAVPTTPLALTDRLALRIFVNTSGKTIELHTENGHLCQIITTFTTGITALNGLTAQVQNFASTDLNISSSVATHTFSIANNAVTYAKIQAVSTTSRLLGSNSTTTPVQEIALGTGLAIVGSTLTPNGSGSLFDLVIAVSDETTPLTTGNAKITFRMPRAVTLTAVRASLGTAQGAGVIFTVDINENGVSILSTKITIDNNELTSTTAATPPVISDVNLADDAQITVDVDQVGDGTARGLKIYLIGNYV